MFPAQYASSHPERPAVIMATSGDTITYAELEARSNRLAHLLRAQGLKRLDHYSVFMENHIKYFEACVAGERSGLYCTCINSYLKADEVAYILQNSESQVLITSPAQLEVAKAAMRIALTFDFAWLSIRRDTSLTTVAQSQLTKAPSQITPHTLSMMKDRHAMLTPRAPQDVPRDFASITGQSAVRLTTYVPLSNGPVEVPRRHGLLVARAALPCSTVSCSESYNSMWWNCHCDGAL